jgi:hypothetical protein
LAGGTGCTSWGTCLQVVALPGALPLGFLLIVAVGSELFFDLFFSLADVHLT